VVATLAGHAHSLFVTAVALKAQNATSAMIPLTLRAICLGVEGPGGRGKQGSKESAARASPTEARDGRTGDSFSSFGRV